MSVDRLLRPGWQGPATPGSRADGLVPGKRTLTSQLDAVPVQRRADSAGADAGVHTAAAHGTSGPAGELPYRDRIQQSFGRHDIGGVRAHVGGNAAEGARAMGATA